MSGWYTVGKEDLLSRVIPAEALVYVLGVNNGYVFDASHTDFALFTPHILLPEQALPNPSFAGGVLDGDNMVWFAAAGDVEDDRSLLLQGVVVYFKLGDVGTLLAFIDSASAGLPQTLTGVNVTAKWNPAGILKL